MSYYDDIREAVAFIEGPEPPESFEKERVALVLGSGLGGVADAIEAKATVPFDLVPHMGTSTAPSHAGRFVFGTLFGVPVVCMQGRIHLYEGYTPEQVAFPIFLMHELGATRIILTNAAGAINTDFRVGDLALISDHIDFQFAQPFTNGLDERLGQPFADMTNAYSPQLRERTRVSAKAHGITLREGVYVGMHGPAFETPAEIRMFRAWGADLVAMSTIQETIAARACGMEVLGLSMCSNMAAGIVPEKAITTDDINAVSAAAAGNIVTLLEDVLTGE